MFEFNKPVEILNGDDFTRSINNTYFELSSKLVKQKETAYLLTVSVKVKQAILPENEGDALLEFSNSLDELNNLSFKLQ